MRIASWDEVIPQGQTFTKHWLMIMDYTLMCEEETQPRISTHPVVAVPYVCSCPSYAVVEQE